MVTTELDPSQEEEYEDESSSSSETGGFSDDSDEDPTFDVIEEARVKLSGMSIKKSRPRVSKEKGPGSEERVELEPAEVEIPELDEKDGKCFEMVEKLIGDGQLEKLKIDQCKVYLRKYGLRLTGKKDILISRIREHLEVKDGGGEKKYPLSSFVLNCKGDSCTGDVVMFEQKVYEGYSIASRSATGPSCGTRIVAGRIVKESYGEAKQQHTFTIEVLWSKGEKPLPPLHPLLIKGRNLYRLMTKRQRWVDEEERRKVLQEKHSRGSHARSSRETRVRKKEMRQKGGTQRKKENKSNQAHPKQECHQKKVDPIETQTDINIPKAPKPLNNEFRPDNADRNYQVQKSNGNEFRAHVNVPQVLKPQNHEYKAPQRQLYREEPSILGCYPQHQPQPHSGWIPPAKSSQDAHKYHHDASQRQPHSRAISPIRIPQAAYQATSHHQPIPRWNSPLKRPQAAASYQQPAAQREPLSRWSSPNKRPQASTYYHMPNAPANFHDEHEQYQNAGMRARHFSPHKVRWPQHNTQQRQQCQYYRKGRCYYAENCKYLHD